MIHILVFMVWTFMLYLKDLEEELVKENEEEAREEITKKLLLKKPKIGLREF